MRTIPRRTRAWTRVSATFVGPSLARRASVQLLFYQAFCGCLRSRGGPGDLEQTTPFALDGGLDHDPEASATDPRRRVTGRHMKKKPRADDAAPPPRSSGNAPTSGDAEATGAAWSEATGGEAGRSRRRKSTVRGFAPHNMITHHIDIGADEATSCGRTEAPSSPTSDWRHVDCVDCIARRPPKLRLVASAGACAVCERQNGRCFATPLDTPYRPGIRGCSHPAGCRCQIVSA
jgi:hypothetical protein